MICDSGTRCAPFMRPSCRVLPHPPGALDDLTELRRSELRIRGRARFEERDHAWHMYCVCWIREFAHPGLGWDAPRVEEGGVVHLELFDACAVGLFEICDFARFAIGLDDANELRLDVRPNYYVPEVL